MILECVLNYCNKCIKPIWFFIIIIKLIYTNGLLGVTFTRLLMAMGCIHFDRLDFMGINCLNKDLILILDLLLDFI